MDAISDNNRLRYPAEQFSPNNPKSAMKPSSNYAFFIV